MTSHRNSNLLELNVQLLPWEMNIVKHCGTCPQLRSWDLLPNLNKLMGWFFLEHVSVCGSKGGAVVRALASHQCGPGSNPAVDAICGLSLLLVLCLAPRGFFPGTPVFSPLVKDQHFQISIRSGKHRHVSTNSHEVLSAPWLNKLQTKKITICHSQIYNLNQNMRVIIII